MKRIATAAVAAVLMAGTFAANAASVPAGQVMSNRDLNEAGLNANDQLAITTGNQVQVRAGDLMSARELSAANLKADDLVTVSAFEGSTRPLADYELR